MNWECPECGEIRWSDEGVSDALCIPCGCWMCPADGDEGPRLDLALAELDGYDVSIVTEWVDPPDLDRCIPFEDRSEYVAPYLDPEKAN